MTGRRNDEVGVSVHFPLEDDEGRTLWWGPVAREDVRLHAKSRPSTG